ncbi:MAG: nuclear transport factor 2 family protein [Pseudomonadota bacterium]
MSGKQNRNGFDGRLQTILHSVMFDWQLSSQKTAAEIMATYMTPDFSAEIDGHTLDHDTFQSRIDRMRRDAEVATQDFVEMMEEGDRVFSMHHISGMSRATGQPFETRVIALFYFSGDKIRKCYLNSVTLGDARDADFASRS